MKTVKGLLLGSAAAFVAMSGAQAADLPMAAPVQYVKVCDTYGAGFFYIPGTQTCLQISGLAEGQFRYDEPTARGSDAINFRALASVSFDARSQTPWGTLRGFVSLGTYFQNNTTTINQFFYGTAPIYPGYGVNTAPNYVYLSNAYVQFAGFTVGYASSNFLYPFGLPEMHMDPLQALTGTLQVAYTADFGNGFTATIAAEDNHYRRAFFDGNLGLGGGKAINEGGSRLPDFVGTLRVVQGWGSAQLSGAIHQVRAGGLIGGFTPGISGAPPGVAISSWDTNYGFALLAGVSINLPMLGAGDKFSVVGSYANGAMAYLAFGPTNSGERMAPLGAGFSDAWLDATGRLHNETGWQVYGSLKHYWTPSLRSNFTVGYTSDHAPNIAGFVIAGQPGGRMSDQNYLSSDVNLIWSPVRDLDIGLEAYNQTGFLNSAQKTAFPTAGARRAAGYDGSTWTFISWIQRRF